MLTEVTLSLVVLKSVPGMLREMRETRPILRAKVFVSTDSPQYRYGARGFNLFREGKDVSHEMQQTCLHPQSPRLRSSMVLYSQC
jgi:hypothetical protein